MFNHRKSAKVDRKIRVLEGIRQGKIGGGESVLLDLVSNLNKELFEPVVLSFTDGPMIQQLEALGIPVFVIHTERPFDFRIWNKVKMLVKKEHIDIIHAHGTRAASNLYRSATSLKLPFVYTCHGWSFHPDQSSLTRALRIRSENFLTRRADRNICVSNANSELGKKLFGDSFDPIVIQNSVDTDKFNPNKSFKDIRTEFNIKNDEVLLLFLARFTYQKQPVVLIRAFEEALKKYPKLKLLMVGDGDEKAAAMRLIEDSGLKDKIILEKFRQDVPDILNAADIFVLPSLWEGLPMALLEAMSMKKAIIASNVDGNPEVIENGKSGILIDTNNLQSDLSAAIIHLTENPGLRKTMGDEAGKRIANHFNVGAMTRKNEELYSGLFYKKQLP